MMKLKHNKKRNTAFLYEVLIRELTKSIISGNSSLKSKIVYIMKEHFGKDKVLFKELELYRNLLETSHMSIYTAEKLLFESKRVHHFLDKKQIFKEQSIVISKINKTLSKKVFSNFVPNYKNLGTLFQIFNNEELSVKQKVLLEQDMIKEMVAPHKDEPNKKEMVPVDNMVYKSFVKNFNSSYKQLQEEQKSLLNKYASSFQGQGVEFKIFLNEEIERLKKIITNSKNKAENSHARESIKEVLNLVEDFKVGQVDKNMLAKILKIQSLARELQN